MGTYCHLCDISMEIYHCKFTSGKNGHICKMQFPAVKGPLTTYVQVSCVTTRIVLVPFLIFERVSKRSEGTKSFEQTSSSLVELVWFFSLAWSPNSGGDVEAPHCKTIYTNSCDHL